MNESTTRKSKMEGAFRISRAINFSCRQEQRNGGNRKHNVKQRETKLKGCAKTRKTKNARKWLNYVCTLKKKKTSKRRRKNGLNRRANFFFFSLFTSFAYLTNNSLEIRKKLIFITFFIFYLIYSKNKNHNYIFFLPLSYSHRR